MKMKVWAIALTESVSGPLTPVFYYNHVKDVWEREFKGGCSFFDEKSCKEKLEELNVFADVIEGLIEA